MVCLKWKFFVSLMLLCFVNLLFFVVLWCFFFGWMILNRFVYFFVGFGGCVTSL